MKMHINHNGNCFYVYDRDVAIEYRNKFEERIKEYLKNNGMVELNKYESCFSVELIKCGNCLADFGILILIDSCCKLNEGTLSMCNDLADLGNNIVSVIALYTASIPVIYNSYDYNNNIENYDEYFRYKRKKYRTDATFSNINGFILEIGICILAFIVALKGYNFFQKYRRKRSALREFLNKDNMKTVLVIMAAGISSRFGGGIKQLAPVGLNGEIIMDYSIHDAIEAGFNKIVFIIRKDIKDAFKEAIGDRIEKI